MGGTCEGRLYHTVGHAELRWDPHALAIFCLLFWCLFRDPWKHCSSTRMASSAVVGTLYAIVAVVEIQVRPYDHRHHGSSSS